MTLKLFKNFLHIERVKVLSIPLKGYYKASDVSRSYKSELVNTMYSESTYANRIYFKPIKKFFVLYPKWGTIYIWAIVQCKISKIMLHKRLFSLWSNSTEWCSDEYIIFSIRLDEESRKAFICLTQISILYFLYFSRALLLRKYKWTKIW